MFELQQQLDQQITIACVAGLLALNFGYHGGCLISSVARFPVQIFMH
jgi:hypothetical protein